MFHTDDQHTETCPNAEERPDNRRGSTDTQPEAVLSRRHFLGSAAGVAVFSLAGLIYFVTAGETNAYAASATPGKSIIFGDTASEAAQLLQQANSVVITNSVGVKARQIDPPSGSLTFTLACDPARQNYLTVKFWGSDLDAAGGQLVLINIDGTALSPAYEYGQDHPEIDRLMPTAAFPGRFFYVTELLPLTLTTGKSQITLTIESLGQASPYTPSQPVAPQTDPSRGLYSATVHSDAFFTPAASEVVGKVPPPGKPLPSPDGLSPYDHAVAQVEQLIETMMSWQLYGASWDAQVAAGAPAALTGFMVYGGLDSLSPVPQTSWTSTQWKNAIYPLIATGNVVNADYLESFAQAYLGSWSKWYQSAEMLDRVVRGLDFYCVAQGANGGFDNTVHSKNWIGGPNRINAASPLEGYGDQRLARAFVLLYKHLSSYLMETIDDDDNPATAAVTRQAAYTRLFLANRTYMLAERGHAPNQDQAQMHCLYWDNEALKLLSPSDAWPLSQMLPYFYQATGITPAGSDTSQYWFSPKGMTLEALGTAAGGYACEYGVNNTDLISRLASLTQDAQIIAQAKKAIEVMSYFYYPWTDVSGYARLVDDAIVGWRNNFGSPNISYGGGSFGPASLDLKHPVAIRQSQLYLAQRQAYAISKDVELAGKHAMDDTVGYIEFIMNYQQLTALPPAPPLTMERGEDFAWADETAACVVVSQHGCQERLYVVLNWRHATGATRVPATSTANNIARIHYTTPLIDRIVTMAMTSTPGYRGLYQVTYGNYVIAMNASVSTSYTVTVPQGHGARTPELISHTQQQPGQSIALAAQTTAVWYIG
jgi:hypothetical protein